jgi:hypothetical protein
MRQHYVVVDLTISATQHLALIAPGHLLDVLTSVELDTHRDHLEDLRDNMRRQQQTTGKALGPVCRRMSGTNRGPRHDERTPPAGGARPMLASASLG